MRAGLVRQHTKTNIEDKEDEDVGVEAYLARSSTVDVPPALMHCDVSTSTFPPQTLRHSLATNPCSSISVYLKLLTFVVLSHMWHLLTNNLT